MVLEILIDSFSKVLVNLGVFLHFLLPLRSLELFIYLHNIFEIVKRKYSTSFVDDKQRKKTKSHVDVSC